MTLQKMNAEDVIQSLSTLPRWSVDAKSSAITREYVLVDFFNAFEFMTQIAVAAEKHDHHPDWRNVYNKVTIIWTTHDVQGLSTKDVNLAQICDEIYAGFDK